MSREKQIEEMARELCPLAVDKECKDCVFEKRSITCNPKTYAKRSINAGYRKQSEGEWETISLKPRGEMFNVYLHICSACNFSYKDILPNGYKFCPECGAKMKGGAE